MFTRSLLWVLILSANLCYSQSFIHSGPNSVTVPFGQSSVTGTYYFTYYNVNNLVRPKLIIAVNGNIITNDLCNGSNPFLPLSYNISFTPGTHTVKFSLLSVNPNTMDCYDPIVWKVEQFKITCNFQIQIKNIFDYGIISVDNVNRNSPYNRTTNVNQNIPVGAIDQDYQNYNRKWNTSGNNLSSWDRERYENNNWEFQSWNRNFNYTVVEADKNKTKLRAGLRKNFRIDKTYTTDILLPQIMREVRSRGKGLIQRHGVERSGTECL